MFGYTRCIIHLMLMSTLVSATPFHFEMVNNRTEQLRHSVPIYNTPALFLSQGFEPLIRVRALEVDTFNEKNASVVWDLDVLIMTEEDLKVVKLDKDIDEVVDFTSSELEGYTYFLLNDPDSKEKKPYKPEIEQYSLDQVLERGLNRSWITSLTLTPDNLIAEHPIQFNETYCIIATFHCSERAFLELDVAVRNPHGELDEEDYKYMHIYILFGSFYAISSLLYFYYVFFVRRNTTKEYNTITSSNSSLKNGEIQLRILIFMFGNSLVCFVTASHMAMLNIDGRHNLRFTGILLRFGSRVSLSIFFAWVLYNLLLMSSGYLFISELKDTRMLWFIRLVTVSSLISWCISDVELAFFPYELIGGMAEGIIELILFIEYVISFISGSYFSIRTYSELQMHGRKATAKRFLATVMLILLPIVFFGFREHRIHVRFVRRVVRKIENTRSFSHIFKLVATLLVAFLWKDTDLETEKVLKGE
ncbi:unnamed protein product [Kuraishia capsulata CBS 1993]|uniref:Intimal thickness related receptor IRP domain-containing protein n=1 Tax=Kuraishia capsulata CBS 1993 TaxID=1382522 RepID=W6MQ03_9ASCO|nr:uncharacterized protein KUCA_T00004735001 [Kuraishia capsulata CBS 1993]CDK28751.1 unnamed protein product [Kuraishia capsulata CBS 1993]